MPVTTALAGQRQEEGWGLLAFSLAKTPSSARDPSASEELVEENLRRGYLMLSSDTDGHMQARMHIDTQSHTYVQKWINRFLKNFKGMGI